MEGYAGSFKHEVNGKVSSKGKGKFPRECVEKAKDKTAKGALKSDRGMPKKAY